MLYDAIVVRDESVNKLARRHAEAGLAKDDAQGNADDGLLAGDEYAAYLEPWSAPCRVRRGPARNPENTAPR